MRRLNVLVALFVLLIQLASFTWAQVNFIPTMMNYQGFLTDQNGAPLDGSGYEITFALYSDTSGVASVVWEETHSDIIINKGLFNVLLGSIDTLAVNDLAGERYLGIRVAGEPEMTPRMHLASVAYSLKSEYANIAQNADTSQNAMHAQTLSASDGDPSDAVVVDAEGNVGIGVPTPTATLDVNGTIKADNLSIGSAYFETHYIAYNNTLTANVWTTIFTGSFMPTGVYIMKAYMNTYMAGGASYRETFSAVFAWDAAGTNSSIDEEISTHQAGHAPNNEVIRFQFHRVAGNQPAEFQIRSTHSWDGTQTAQFTFLRVL
ncbi:MAG: hypothetical protein GY808_12275 [Gammaproteobacteria bacterium]|nr:hypothetical protein [Gammaproteobacteria bacterium]